MTVQSAFRWMLVVGISGLIAACAMAPGTLGEDPRSQTNAKTVTWTDGRQAIAINCNDPGACQTRAVAICNASSGRFAVLQMENMPERGNMTVIRGPASVVIRCSA